MVKKKILLLLLAAAVVASLVTFGACGKPTPPDEEEAPPEEEVWQWPQRIHIAASGSSGMAKYTSWTSMLETDTGMAVRVIPEASGVNRAKQVKNGNMLLFSEGKSATANIIEAEEEFATKEVGPFQIRIVWNHDLANSCVFVRGDSKIDSIYDIGKGTKWAVWSMRESVLHVPRAILQWIQVPEEDIIWFNAGSTKGMIRAIMQGRADVAWFFPTSSMMYEAAAAPYGIKVLDLNADENPEGAARFRDLGAGMYAFAPIETGIPAARGHWGTVGYKNEMTRADTDPDLIYHLAKWLDENYERYKEAYATNYTMSIEDLMENLETTYIPCHDGLIRYLKDKGLWTKAHERRQEQNVALITTYRQAWEQAIAVAEQYDIEVNPTNERWILHWENYLKTNNVPVITMHQSLEKDAIWVEKLGLD